MMEKLQAPQTHVGLKNMIAEIDEDNDGKVSFREVIIAYRETPLERGHLVSSNPFNFFFK